MIGVLLIAALALFAGFGQDLTVDARHHALDRMHRQMVGAHRSLRGDDGNGLYGGCKERCLKMEDDDDDDDDDGDDDDDKKKKNKQVCSLFTGTTYTDKCHAACDDDDGDLEDGPCEKPPPSFSY